jgi:hypothetical protein
MAAGMFSGQYYVGGVDSGQKNDEHNMMHGEK